MSDSKAPELAMWYFPFGGRAYHLRLALRYANVPYTDHRIQFKDWATTKPDMPFGAMPVIDVPGRGRLTQNLAISTFIGKRCGLYPSDAFAGAQVDELGLVLEDIIIEGGRSMRMADAEKKAAREKLSSETLPRIMGQIEAVLAKRGGVTKELPYSVGKSLTMADLKVFSTFWQYRDGNMDYVENIDWTKYPNLSNVYHGVLNSDLLKEHTAEFAKG